MADKISVVMACYAGDKLWAVVAAVQSVLNQSIPFLEFIIVIDGPIDEGIASYLKLIETSDSRVRLLQYLDNRGAAFARNFGMAQARGDFIAIMDADDICAVDRLEKQINAIYQHGVDAVWSWQEEFYDETGKFAGIKKSAEYHEDIVNDLRFRCLLPDPSTFIRRECFTATSGYGSFENINIDHQFFIKIALSGFRLHCLPAVLIKVRVSIEQRRRRGGFRLLMQDVALRRWMKKEGFIGYGMYIKAIMSFAIFRLMPNYARDVVYRFVLRHGNG